MTIIWLEMHLAKTLPWFTFGQELGLIRFQLFNETGAMSHQTVMGLFVTAALFLTSVWANDIKQLFKKFEVCAESWQSDSNFSVQR